MKTLKESIKEHKFLQRIMERSFVTIFVFWAFLTIITPTLILLSENSALNLNSNGEKSEGIKVRRMMMGYREAQPGKIPIALPPASAVASAPAPALAPALQLALTRALTPVLRARKAVLTILSKKQ